MLAAAGAVGVLRAPGVDHRHDVTERATAVLALVGTALAAVVCNMLATARAVRVLGTPVVQQRAQRMVLRAAIDAEVFAALAALEQRVLAATGSAWMLRAPAVQQRTRIARWRSTVLAVFTHETYYSIISGLCGKQLFYPPASMSNLRRCGRFQLPAQKAIHSERIGKYCHVKTMFRSLLKPIPSLGDVFEFAF